MSTNFGIGKTPTTKLDVDGTVTATAFSGPLTGNATTASALETARNIGGVSFDGSANINLPGVNQAGNQDTTGTATVATTVTITDNESTNEENAIIFAAGGDLNGGNLGLESDGNLTYNPSTGKITATGFIGNLTGDSGSTIGNLTLSNGSITDSSGTISFGDENLNTTCNVGIGTTNPGTLLQLEGTAPYLTLKNSTSENTDGGCESKIIFEDHSNSTLAQIQASHDGTSDDTKGDLIFSTHTGSSLTEKLRIDSSGNIQIGGNLTNTSGVMSFNDDIVVTRNDIQAKNIKTSYINNNTWNQLGSDIDGESSGDKSSYSIDMSANGKIIVIGAPENTAGGTSAGHTRIYEFNETTLKWTQKGSDIDGGADDHSGFNISISGDGNSVCIGARYSPGSIKIYKWNGSDWAQKGSTITGQDNSLFGHSNDISYNGDTFVVGASSHDTNPPQDYIGLIQIYDYNYGTSDWVQRGDDIHGDADDLEGHLVRISFDGNVIASGAAGDNTANGDDSGRTRIYYWSGTAWTQRGSDIIGAAAGDKDGEAISLSGDGYVLATGSYNHSSEDGHIRVFYWDGSAWTQRGSDIQAEASDDLMGQSVSLNSDGTVLVSGGTKNDDAGTDAGQVRVYKWDGISWNQVGSDIDGAAAGDRFGHNTAVSADGNIVAGGALFHDSNKGHVRVYSLGEYINNLSVGENISYSNTNNALLNVSAVSGTDTAGKNLTIAAGQGTGTGTGGSIIFQTADGSGSSGSSANSLATAMTIADDGNVGIGTDNPQAQLHIYKDDDTNNNLVEMLRLERHCDDISTSTNAEGGYISLHVDDDNASLGEIARISWRCDNYDSTTGDQTGEDDGRLGFWTTKDNTIAERMTITPDGNVGIGTDNPDSVDSTIKFAVASLSSVHSILQNTGGGNAFARFMNNGSSAPSEWWCGIGSSDNFGIYQKQLDGVDKSLYRLYVATNGNVGIGTNSPAHPLVVAGNISVVNNVYYGGSLILSSDDRLKDNEIFISNATETLLKLRAQTYDKKEKMDTQYQNELSEYNTKKTELEQQLANAAEEDKPDIQQQIDNLEIPTNNTTKESGLITQEVYYDAPELRHLVDIPEGITPDPDIPSSDDPSQDPDYSSWGDEPSFLNYIGFIPFLIKGFQEQQTIIANLTSRIEALENP